MPNTPQEMGQAIIANLPAKTGHTLDEWVEAVLARGQAPRKERVAWLKAEHGLGHVTAEVIASYAAAEREGSAPPPIDDVIAYQYGGPKAALRPLYERLAAEALALGDDVALEPRKTMVSLTRGRQFALIQPTNRTRIDLGVRLNGVVARGRLIEAAEFGSGNMTHRIPVSCEAEIDDELRGWLRAAYETAAARR
jgi:predicted transport protein